MIDQKAVLILVPARYDSQRLPGKPLVCLLDRPLIAWVSDKARAITEQCQQAGLKAQYAIVTDHQLVEEFCRDQEIPCVRVDDDVPSGSERIYLAYQRYFSDSSWDAVLNLQGDEPLIDPTEILKLVQGHLAQEQADVSTLVCSGSVKSLDFKDPNRVKVAYNEDSGRCFYFSRAPIPYQRDGELEHQAYFHIGVYCYRPKSLATFCQAPPSRLEQLEKLEQLRALELGMNIYAIRIEQAPRGVDTPEDVIRVEGVLSGQKRHE